jgi:XTP/dITP diphosphohydrolase
MKQIVIASNNKGKLEEFAKIFTEFNIEVIPQNVMNVPEIDEPYMTFIENSLHKARHCSKHTGLPALADDSGICVPALQNKPGIYSARYAGIPKSDLNNLNKLIDDMKNIDNRKAYFYCSLVFVRNHKDPQPIIAEGIFHGEITTIARGTHGHGYDPIFLIPELEKTAAELSSEEKNRVSHRGLAMQLMTKRLKEFNLI